MKKLKPYKKDHDISYVGSIYPVMELLTEKPEIVEVVYIHSAFIDNCGLIQLCQRHNISTIFSDRIFQILNQKENSYVIGVFRKFSGTLSSSCPHIVLVNPSDMGNLGTMIRTAVGFGIHNMALITPAADIYNPKTIRASMGAIFRINHEHFTDFHDYTKKYPKHKVFPFMLDGKTPPEEISPCLFSLVFGSESTGLDRGFSTIGQVVKIPLSSQIDSLNLSIAAGIGMYVFASKNGLI